MGQKGHSVMKSRHGGRRAMTRPSRQRTARANRQCAGWRACRGNRHGGRRAMRRISCQRTAVVGRLRVGWRAHRGNRHGGGGAPMRRSSWQRTTVVGRRHAAGVGRHSDLSARPPAPFSTPTCMSRCRVQQSLAGWERSVFLRMRVSCSVPSFGCASGWGVQPW